MRAKRELPPLLLRADAGSRQGTGHVMRSLALAGAWRARGGTVRFLTARSTPEFVRRIQLAGAIAVDIGDPCPKRSDIETTVRLIEQLQRRSGAPAWVILDGYHFDPAYQTRIRRSGCRLMVIDDHAHLPRYDADIVLNHGIQAAGLDYPTSDDAWCLLGTHYALLRAEFVRWRGFRRRVENRASNILVTLGGGDADNVTRKVLLALRRLEDLDLNIKVLIGALNPHRDELRALAGSRPNIALQTDAADPAVLMAWADIAIAAAGTTAWELAFMQVPALLAVLADNQEAVAAAVDRFGAAQSLGRAERLEDATIAAALRNLIEDAGRRSRMAAQGAILVDGLGVERVLSAMDERGRFSCADDFYLRPAEPADRLLLWQWANDPAVRQNSFNNEAIDWAEHEAWCAKKLASADCRIWIVQIGALPVGQIRYERIGDDTAEISLSIGRGFRGKQLGNRLLEASGERALRELGVRWLQAKVRSENQSSCRAFLKAGFQREEQDASGGAAHWVFRRAARARSWMEDHAAVH